MFNLEKTGRTNTSLWESLSHFEISLGARNIRKKLFWHLQRKQGPTVACRCFAMLCGQVSLAWQQWASAFASFSTVWHIVLWAESRLETGDIFFRSLGSLKESHGLG